MNVSQNLWRIGVIACSAAVLAACQSNPAVLPPPAVNAVATASALFLRQAAFSGLYEVAVDAGSSVFIATSGPEGLALVERLDARSLQLLQTIELPRRAFALGMNRTTNTLYAGNTVSGSITVIDAGTGLVKGVIQLATPVKNEDGKESVAHTRKVLADEVNNRVFVTSPEVPGTLWIIDGKTNTLTHTVDTGEPWTAGVAYDPVANRVYVSQGGVSEIMAIDPDTGTIVQKISTGDTKSSAPQDSKHFFINLAIDVKGQRLFSTDANSGKLYVFDIASGKVLAQVPAGVGLLDVAYNPQRNEVYTTNRGVTRSDHSGTGAVTIIDAASYTVRRVLDLPAHPNSLALNADGSSLYVTVRRAYADVNPHFRKGGRDSVVRIDLQD